MMATDEALRIYVIDEGVGFEADDAIAAGLSTGLAGMRERATLLGGVFLVSSTPGAGTTIEVELPLAPGIAAEINRDAERDVERDTQRDQSRDALRDERRDIARDLARDTVRDAARDMESDAAYDQKHDQKHDQKKENEP
jgi:hypothetical protein